MVLTQTAAIACLLAAPAADTPAPTLEAPPAIEAAARQDLPPTLPKKQRRAANTAVGVGSAVTAVTLGIGGLVSARHLDSGDPQRRSAGRVGAIPFVGPIVGASRLPEKDRIGFTLIAVYQWIGLSTMTIGAALVRHDRRIERQRGAPPINQDGAAVMAGVGGLGWLIAYSFTAGIAKAKYERIGRSTFGDRLRIPIVGGALAAADAPSYVGGYLALGSTIAQVGAIAVMSVGIASLVKQKRRKRSRVAVVPVVDRTTAQLTATVRF